MFGFDADKMSQMMDTYVIPWGINIVIAIVIYVVGKMIVGAVPPTAAKRYHGIRP